MKDRMKFTFFPRMTVDMSTVMFFSVVVLLLISTGDVFAITNDAIKAPMQNLHKDAFDWMFAVKIAGGVLGGAFSLAKQSPMPFAMACGTILGISFFDNYLSTAAAGALI